MLSRFNFPNHFCSVLVTQTGDQRIVAPHRCCSLTICREMRCIQADRHLAQVANGSPFAPLRVCPCTPSHTRSAGVGGKGCVCSGPGSHAARHRLWTAVHECSRLGTAEVDPCFVNSVARVPACLAGSRGLLGRCHRPSARCCATSYRACPVDRLPHEAPNPFSTVLPL